MENPTYVYMLIFGGLLLLSRLLEHIAESIKLPGMLLILVMGLLFPDFLGNHQSLITISQADSIATLGLVVILFYGGLTTRWSGMRHVLTSGLRMATLGCLITAGAATALIYGLSYLHLQFQFVPVLKDATGNLFPADLPLALFLGAMLCSTDATAVLSILRPIASKIPEKLLSLIECESGFNDPVAVILAGVALALAKGHLESPIVLIRAVGLEFVVGALIGWAGANLGIYILRREHYLKPNSGSEAICLALLMLSAATSFLCGGSPLLCAYVMGCVIGNSDEIDCIIAREFAIINRASELIVLICLGLVVFPVAVWPVKWYALLIFAVTMLSRLLMTFFTLHRSPFKAAEKGFSAFAGLRGAVPIAIALEAAASPVAWGPLMPAFALAVVLYGLVFQGYFLPAAADILGKALKGNGDLVPSEQAS
jgi:CPA1 family monovalent cation:H+ antiporter/cell volume regulation protein A